MALLRRLSAAGPSVGGDGLAARSSPGFQGAAGGASPLAASLYRRVDAPSARRAAVLDAVAEQVHSHTDAFYVVDLQEVVRKHAQWAAELPRVRPFFAVKCNDDARIVSVLAQLGCGFDCASKGEISMVLGQGVAPTDIIFAHPAKQVRLR